MATPAPPLPQHLPPMRYYRRVFALAAIAVLGYFLFRILQPFASAILWASMLAYMMMPLQRRLTGKWHRPSLSAGLLTSATLLVVVGPVALFAVAFVRQATDLLMQMKTEAQDRRLPALQLVLELGPVRKAMEWIGQYVALTPQEILSKAGEGVQQVLQEIAALGGTVVIGAFGVVVQFLMTLFLFFFLVRDGAEMVTRFIRLVPLSHDRKVELQATLGGVTSAVVLGALTTSAVQGILLGTGFAIAGLPSPVVFGAVGAAASLVPVVGTALVWVPAVITLVAQGRTSWAVFLAVWSIVLVAGSDNVIRPLVISGRSKASTLLVFVGLLGGVAVFGFAGVFMGPLILTLVGALLRYADEGETPLAIPSAARADGGPEKAALSETKDPLT